MSPLLGERLRAEAEALIEDWDRAGPFDDATQAGDFAADCISILRVLVKREKDESLAVELARAAKTEASFLAIGYAQDPTTGRWVPAEEIINQELTQDAESGKVSS